MSDQEEITGTPEEQVAKYKEPLAKQTEATAVAQASAQKHAAALEAEKSKEKTAQHLYQSKTVLPEVLPRLRQDDKEPTLGPVDIGSPYAIRTGSPIKFHNDIVELYGRTHQYIPMTLVSPTASSMTKSDLNRPTLSALVKEIPKTKEEIAKWDLKDEAIPQENWIESTQSYIRFMNIFADDSKLANILRTHYEGLYALFTTHNYPAILAYDNEWRRELGHYIETHKKVPPATFGPFSKDRYDAKHSALQGTPGSYHQVPPKTLATGPFAKLLRLTPSETTKLVREQEALNAARTHGPGGGLALPGVYPKSLKIPAIETIPLGAALVASNERPIAPLPSSTNVGGGSGSGGGGGGANHPRHHSNFLQPMPYQQPPPAPQHHFQQWGQPHGQQQQYSQAPKFGTTPSPFQRGAPGPLVNPGQGFCPICGARPSDHSWTQCQGSATLEIGSGTTGRPSALLRDSGEALCVDSNLRSDELCGRQRDGGHCSYFHACSLCLDPNHRALRCTATRPATRGGFGGRGGRGGPGGGGGGRTMA
ncbi:hypothetical protein RQP46_009915 [Phenoliferia psychrophenolica]